MLKALGLLILFGNSAAQQPVENVHLTCSTLSSSQDVYYFCPATMYYFRCEVTKCSHLKWEVSGEEVLEVFPYSSRNDIIPADPLNLLIHTISQSDVETETNFTSYLWFNSSFYPSNENRNDFEIVCRGRHSNKTMTLKIPGVVGHPSELTVSSFVNESSGEVGGRLQWSYAGDRSAVAYFDVNITAENNVMVNMRVPNTSSHAAFYFQEHSQGSEYSATVAAVGHCEGTAENEQLIFKPAILQQEQEECDCKQMARDDYSTSGFNFVGSALALYIILLVGMYIVY